MQILVLGAAAGGGFPQWNSNAPACRRARAGDQLARPRTQSSLAVSRDGQRWFLLNASPDLRAQIESNPPLHPREGVRSTPIAGVVLTNADVDHVAGLLTLRENQPFTIYATERVHAVLRSNSIFNVLNAALVRRAAVAPEQPFAMLGPDGSDSGLRAEMFAVPGKVALYMENPDAGPDLGTAAGDTVGLKLFAASRPERYFFYIPGCADLPPDLTNRLAGAPLVFFDGTLWSDDELIRTGAGQKTGKRMGHISLSGPKGSLALFASLGVRRKIFVHMNNSNPVLLDDSAELAAAAEAGWEVATDGMQITL